MQSRSLSNHPVLLVLLIVLFLFWTSVAVGATVPLIASAMGRELDMQAAERLGQQAPAQGLSLSVMTPVDLNNLERSNPLARQVQEEITRWFIQAGYEVHEIRKGASVLFEPDQGELLLTRQQRLLGNTRINSKAIVSGTYTITPRNVRFNMKIVATKSREVLGMSTVTIPICREVAALLRSVPSSSSSSNTSNGNKGQSALVEPTVVTLLP